MPIRKVSLFLFSLIVLCVLAAESVNAEVVRVFLLGGQSNMAGRARLAGLPTDPVNLQLPQDDILFYYGRSLTTLRPGSGRNFGPEVTFGRTVADAFPTEKFAIIKYARGGTSLSSDWEPVTGSTYSVFRKTVSKGLAELKQAGHTTKVAGMLWTQGERDAKAGRTTKQYETDLKGFIADIRSHYGEELPFFISRLSRGQTDISESGLKNIRTAQENVAASDSHVWLVDTDEMGLKRDHLHFDSNGQISLGRAFGKAFVDTFSIKPISESCCVNTAKAQKSKL